MSNPWIGPIKLEMKVADIISKQAKHGCNFRKQRASWLVHRLNETILNIDLQLIPMLPPMMVKGSTYAKPFKLNGQFQKWPGLYCERVGLSREEVSGPFSCIEFVPFDPGKVARVKSVMMDLGWVPTSWNEKKMPFQVWQYRKRLERTTYNKFMESLPREERELYAQFVDGFIDKNFKNKTKNYMIAVLYALGFNPKRKTPTFLDIKKKLLLKQFWPTSPEITEDSFESLEGKADSRALEMLVTRMKLCHRRGLLEGLISVTRKDGKISGEAASCATPTARMKHRKIVNIPAGRAFLGHELRDLFIGDYRDGAKPVILKKPLKEGMRVKPLTNILQKWDDKKEAWKDAGTYRDLIPRNQDSFIGADGAALELRMLAHYLVSIPKMLYHQLAENHRGHADVIGTYARELEVYDGHTEDHSNELNKILKLLPMDAVFRKYASAWKSGVEYRYQVLNGDIHTHNQNLAGLATRDAAKTFIYAFLYGSGDANLGGLLGGGKEEGAKAKETFLRECPCIPVLIEWVSNFAVNGGEHKGFNYDPGTIPAIDGRPLIMRRDPYTGDVMTHKALNTLLQSAGSICMKVANCFLINWVDKSNIDGHQVIMMHDEMQWTCKSEHVPALRDLLGKCLKTAGEHLKMDCPLASDSIWGSSWLFTH